MNTVKTGMLMAVLTILMVLAGSALGGRGGMQMAFMMALLMNFFSYWFSDKIVLAMYRAKEVNRNEYPELFSLVERLTQTAGIPMPKLYVTPQPVPNAFATGRSPQHAAIAVTTGITQLLSREELEGVLAHEIAHIRNRDILIGTIAATMAGAITMLARIAQWGMIFGGMGGRDDRDRNSGGLGAIVMMIVAPIAAMLIQMAISRSREYKADQAGANICGRPLGLANALQKLEDYSLRIPMEGGTPATAHMFIVNPFRGKDIFALFSTHPPVAERIKRLKEMK
ncbi:MAG: zinc metalloprotease HtpX [Candidatus Schekmanbacteria bacterium]|nr:zinc metalloprotease HtpX [Candidatus Schekmanbacteria bacterium]